MRNLTLKQLKAIQAIVRPWQNRQCRQGCWGCTPPAVTIQLRQLEEEIGLALFDRTSDGMRPTAAGLAVRRRGAGDRGAAAAAATIRSTPSRACAAAACRLGVVSTAKYFAPRLMAAFMKEYPDIDMRLVVGNRAETIASLRNHDVDVALMGRPAEGRSGARLGLWRPSAGDRRAARPSAGDGARHLQGADRRGAFPHPRAGLRHAHLA